MSEQNDEVRKALLEAADNAVGHMDKVCGEAFKAGTEYEKEESQSAPHCYVHERDEPCGICEEIAQMFEAAGVCPKHGRYQPCPRCVKDEVAEKKNRRITDHTAKPEHYNSDPSGLEAIDVIENAPGNLYNCAKYLWRGGKKDGQPTERDIEKARWYLFREFYRQGYITLEQWERIVGRS